MINEFSKLNFLEKLINFFKKDFLIVWIILICSIITYVCGRIIFDPNPIVLGESINFWTYGLASVKESITTFRQFPLWDSQIGAGFSLIGHPYIQQFYPLIYPFIFLIEDTILATRFFIFTHLLLAGIFFFYFLHSLKVSKIAAFLGTLVYINNSFFYIYLLNGLFSSIFTLTWLPLILFSFIRAVETRSKWFAFLAAFLVAIMIFAGGLYSALFTSILLGIFFFIYLIQSILKKSQIENKINNIFSELKIGFLVLIFIILFSSVKFLPVLEYRAISDRETVSLATAESNLDSIRSPFREIIVGRLSNFFPFPAGAREAPFVHRLFFVLVLLSIFSKRKSLSIPLISFTAIAFIASLGNKSLIDIYAIFYYLIPGFKSFGDTTRFLVLTWFTLPLLSALGLEVFMQIGKEKIRKPLQFASILLAIVFLGLIVINQKQRLEQYALPLYKIPESASYIKGLEKESSSPLRVYNKWISGQHSGFTYAAIQNNLEVVNSLYVGAVPNFEQLDFVSRENNLSLLEKKYKLFSILNTKYIVSSKDDQDPQTQYTKVIKIIKGSQGDGYVSELLNFRSRVAFIPTGILLVGNEDTDVFNAVKARSIVFLPGYNIYTTTIFSGGSRYLEDYDLEEIENFSAIILYKNKIKNEKKFQEILARYEEGGGKMIQGDIFHENSYTKRRMPNSLFEDRPAFIPKERAIKELRKVFSVSSTRPASFEVLKKEGKPGYLRMHFKTRGKGFLVLSESFYPGWEAKLDGENIKLFMADSIVKGVIVDKVGEHILILSYRPKSFLIGSIVSAGSVFLIPVLLRRKLYKKIREK